MLYRSTDRLWRSHEESGP